MMDDYMAYSMYMAIQWFFFQWQVTISYGQIEMVGHPALNNVVEIPNAQFSEEDDPTR